MVLLGIVKSIPCFINLMGTNWMSGTIGGCRLFERADAAQLAGILLGWLRRPAAAAL